MSEAYLGLIVCKLSEGVDGTKGQWTLVMGIDDRLQVTENEVGFRGIPCPNSRDLRLRSGQAMGHPDLVVGLIYRDPGHPGAVLLCRSG
jgi:hypothetical protein